MPLEPSREGRQHPWPEAQIRGQRPEGQPQGDGVSWGRLPLVTPGAISGTTAPRYTGCHSGDSCLSSCPVPFQGQLPLVMPGAPRLRWLQAGVNSAADSSSPRRTLSHWHEDGVAVLVPEVGFDHHFCPCTLSPIPARWSPQSGLQARNCGPQDTTRSFSTSHHRSV